MNILLVDVHGKLPKNTGTGATLVRWGLISGLTKLGCRVALYSVGSKVEHADRRRAVAEADSALKELGCRLWYEARGDRDQMVSRLRNVLTEFAPDVVLAYGPDSLRLYRSTDYPAKCGIMSLDLVFLPLLYEPAYRLFYGDVKEKLRAIRNAPRTLRQGLNAWRDFKSLYHRADFVISGAQNHSDWLAKRLDVPYLYASGPVAALAQRPSPHIEAEDGPKKFILVGGLGGVSTLSGLNFFALKVLPHLTQAIQDGRLEFHVIGGGRHKDSRLQRLFDSAGVVSRGYVQDLKQEYRTACAVIVPTPFRMGFRTRILDAFRHGQCVIAHEANRAGISELTNGQNCLLAASGKDMAGQVLAVAGDPVLRNRLAAQAMADFEARLSGDVSCQAILDFIAAQLGTNSTGPAPRAVATGHV